MSSDPKKKSSGNSKKEAHKFPSKNVKHDPQAESARAVFRLQDINMGNEK